MVRRRPRSAVTGHTRNALLVAAALDGGPITLALVLGAAFLAGFVDSIVGGGGLIQVPALLAAYPDIAPQPLLGTNKLGSICGTSSASLRYSRFVRLPWRSLLPAAAGAFAAALLGASLVGALSAAVFRPLVPIMLALVLGYVLLHQNLGVSHAPRRLEGGRQLLAWTGIAVIGLYDGFFGPGTGSFLMLLFMRAYGYDFLHASAAARFINVATNAGALLYFAAHGDVHWALGLGLGFCNASGSVVGTRTARRHGVGFVRILFIAVVVALIAKTTWNALR